MSYQGYRDGVENSLFTTRDRQTVKRQPIPTDKQTTDNRDKQTNRPTDHRQPRQAIAQPGKQRALAQNDKQSVAENPLIR